MALRPPSRAALLLAALLGALLAGCSDPPPFAQLSGLMLDAQLDEVSGLAASRRHPDTLWMLNDGGNAARLHAVSRRGGRLATLRIDGVDNTDWEDLAAFDLDGRHYLLVADTGDNGGLRRTLQLHVIEEPASLADAVVKPAWSIAFRWPDGARDCEAVAVDAAAGQVLLVSKKRQPPELFALPLRPRAPGLQVARALGTLAGVPQADAEEVRANARLARIRSQVTAADVAADRHALAVLTYRDVLVYPRRGRETWAQALARPPQVHPLPWLPQAEALAWSADSRALYATGELSPAPLLYLHP
ncbi:hypothetical protein MQC88_08880 [Luteimonas sp. 50]|uniref:Integral membrane protein n=1 Tax=Cognatiluteimonas sedimenti TaxID=2927791 RepID=A0ABT0A508_9GAMM|nr:hypothetical protein [Lysobacter sedimenti]MCJ0826069.1 hypothetical protein [Lysobacter sedimenti]